VIEYFIFVVNTIKTDTARLFSGSCSDLSLFEKEKMKRTKGFFENTS